MVISCFYNKKNKVLILTSQSEVKSHLRDGNVVKLLDENNKVVGLNIFEIEGYNSGVVKLKDEHMNYLDLLDDASYGFVYGNILSCEPHPKSEKLQICSVDIKSEILQIVCGAANCKAGYMAVVARPYSVLPSSMKIIPSKLIDIESNGMLCSFKELAIIKDGASGIILEDINLDLIGTPFGG